MSQPPVSEPRDFWLACGHHFLDRDASGQLVVTDEFLKTYLARPELAPPPGACAAERSIHQGLMDDPRRPVTPGEIAAILDEDARENWQHLIGWRDFLVRHATAEAAYLASVHERLRFPPIFLDQLVQLILRNMLHGCRDPFVLRAAELFFRTQRLTVYQGSFLAVDEEMAGSSLRSPSPLAALRGRQSEPVIDILGESNADTYWERSDRFDMALDLTAGRRGLAALGGVVACWLRHLLHLEVAIEALTELQEVTLKWYVGLDASATRIGDALWMGEELDREMRERVVGLYRLTFSEDTPLLERARGAPTYLITAMSPSRALRLKPQNLITGLPVMTAHPALPAVRVRA